MNIEGDKSTRAERKHKGNDTPIPDPTRTKSEAIEITGDMLEGLKKAMRVHAKTGYVRVGIGRTINLERFSPTLRYESVRYDCTVELPTLAEPDKVLQAIEICRSIAEEDVNSYYEELKTALSDED